MQDEMESGQAREYQSERAHETVRERAHGSVGYAEWTTSKRGLRLISFPKKQASREEAGEDGPRPRDAVDGCGLGVVLERKAISGVYGPGLPVPRPNLDHILRSLGSDCRVLQPSASIPRL